MANGAADAGAVRALPTPAGGGSYDRVPPHNLDAEASILGAMLLSRGAIAEVSELVGADDFYRGAHRTMYEAMRDLYDRGEPVDPVTLADELEHRGTLEDVGGAVGIAELVSRVPTAANALYYARIVADQALRRRLIDAGTGITRLGYDPSKGADEAVDSAEQTIYEVAQRGYAGEFVPMKDLLMESFERIEKLHESNSAITGLATGFADFDELTAGLQPQNLIVIAARPAMGKSTLVTNIATNVTVEQRKPAVLFSLEMSQRELIDRILAAESRVDSERLRTGRLHETDWPKLSQAMGRLAEAPLFIDDTPGINMMEIRAKCRRLKAKHGLELVIVDYLQLMQSHRRAENRVQEVSELSRGMKILAKELDVPVIALSQLSRKPEDRTDRRPQLSDLRESGCLTADARVLRADTGAEVTMGQLYASGERNIPVWTVNADYQIVRGTMTRVFPSGVKPVFRLRLESGRQIGASANHPFLAYEGWRRLDELAAGDRIAVPRAVGEPDAATAWAEPEVVLLAHLIGDGCFASRQPLHYTSADPANLEAVEDAARHFGITPRRVRQNGWWHVYLPSPQHLAHGRRNPIACWLDEMGLDGKRSREKFVPQAIFGLKRPQVALFLRHLWATGGHLGRTGRQVRLHYASSSGRLINELQLLLLRLGITSRIHTASKRGRADTFQLWIIDGASQLSFLEEVGVHGARGRCAHELAAVLQSVPRESVPRSPTLDTVPARVWEQVHERRRQRGMTLAELQAASGLRSMGGTAAAHGPSRERLHAMADALGDDGLRCLAQSHLYWDRIQSVEPLGPQPVYDGTVVDHHNFIANGIVVENSIEQDSDLVAFIYRDEVYHPDSDAKGEAELIVSKHRNGPLRTVRLSFIGHHSRFANMARRMPPL